MEELLTAAVDANTKTMNYNNFAHLLTVDDESTLNNATHHKKN